MQTLIEILQNRFHLEQFRPHQEAVCSDVTQGRNVLLVMPTGAGKSLCYQLPGIARGGTTIVVMPLIALMDDQAQRMQQLGFRVERIHSGRPREELRAACRLYLQGELDFMLLAPERLSVSGFPEMLAKRMPTLIAIDEAHCISQWGHSFRPDYRLIGKNLHLMQQVPVIAMTATATPEVQKDILLQLELTEPVQHVHGFWRENLGVRVESVTRRYRAESVKAQLENPITRPAIVYVSTRKMAEEIGSYLAEFYPTAVYHAGLGAGTREEVQRAFLQEEVSVIVATVAFGMGIDKANIRSVIHAGLPSSLENYYQEIGRAGRDGQASRAILLQSGEDLRLLHYFQDRGFPQVTKLEALLAKVPEQGTTKKEIMDQLPQLDAAEMEQHLHLLQVHQALVQHGWQIQRVPAEEEKHWKQRYHAHKQREEARIKQLTRFVYTEHCRMQFLVNYFGDRPNRPACGQCDNCLRNKS